MNVDVEMFGSTTTLRLRGDLDDAAGGVLRDCVAATPSGPVVVDLADLGFIDSAGIWSLVAVQRSLRNERRRLQVVGARGQVLSVLEMSGVLTALELAG